MIIYDDIVKNYLNDHSIDGYKNAWYFTDSLTARTIGGNIFTVPENNAGVRQKVQFIHTAVSGLVNDFRPTNASIWSLLFPDWEEVLENVYVDLIIGFPEPHDATVEYGADGQCHIIFDLICWTKYIGLCEISELVQNLMTHELCHVLIHRHTERLTEALDSADYHCKLDAITFDEGLAHLLSYNAKEIDTVNWESKKMREVWEKNSARMQAALREQNAEKQRQYTYDALCGDYYDKFGCMCGMLCFAHVWTGGGNSALKAAFENGFDGFARKAVL